MADTALPTGLDLDKALDDAVARHQAAQVELLAVIAKRDALIDNAITLIRAVEGVGDGVLVGGLATTPAAPFSPLVVAAVHKVVDEALARLAAQKAQVQ